MSDNVYCFQDTCNVYVIRHGREAVIIDFGSGTVLDELQAIGVDQVTAVLMTHHHRDQGQGLARAVDAGIPIWVPYNEQDLFAHVDTHWQMRSIYNNYDVRQDRFSLLTSVPIAGTLQDYGVYSFGGTEFTIVPTPGHTLGSISCLAHIDDHLIAFTGDLIAAPGKVWSMAATQWTYNGAEGVPASVASLLDLKRRNPDLLLPSHGESMNNPDAAIDLLVSRLSDLLAYRRQNPRLRLFIDQPYEALTPHLLWNRTSMAYSYVLLSQSGKALFFDYGYDLMTGLLAAGTDRSSRRPWLYSLDALKRRFGVTQIDVALPTHYHDDHVAGLNLLRSVEGTQIWAAENYADLLDNPARYDLPCLWYDPIPVDRQVPLNQAIQWEEYTLTLYPLPGHTQYAVAIELEVDGRRVLVAGDQYQSGDEYNYVYKNRFHLGDYPASAALYRRLNPDLILTGHWPPLWVEPGYFDQLTERGEAIDRLHRDLLPLESVHVDVEGAAAWIYPYQSEVKTGQQMTFEVEIRNPSAQAEELTVTFILPNDRWTIQAPQQQIRLDAYETGQITFDVQVGNVPVRRARVAVDLMLGEQRFGQQAEALVTVC